MSRPFVPREYQQIAIDHIHEHRRSALFAEMGMGKTASTLKAAMDLSLVEDVFPMLVCAPLRVANSTWPDEAAKWDDFNGLRVSPITGTPQERTAGLRAKAEVYTVNYENIPWLTEQFGKSWPFKMVVPDESTRLKGFRLRQGTQRSAALASIARMRMRWLNMTGTPSPNGLKDLWGQTWFLDEGRRLGMTYEAFKDRWFQRSHSGYGIDPLPYAQKEISETIADICLSINAKDWFDIKEPIVRNIVVDLPRVARDYYNRMKKIMFMEVEGRAIEALNAAAKMNKLLQIANGAAYVTAGSDEWVRMHDAKLDALESVMNEAAGMPVLVAYNFVSDKKRIMDAFPQARYLDKKPQTIHDWNAGKIDMLLAHRASAGHGLNLQDGGNILVNFGLTWDLELHQQILERIGPTRQMQAGHDRPVFVYNIVARNTADETVAERLDDKRSVQEILLESLTRRDV